MEKIVGRMEGGWWGQIHDFTPDAEERLGQKGRLVAVISWRSEEMGAMGRVELGREILGRLQELYFGGEGEERTGLRKAIAALVSEFPEVEAEAAAIVGETVQVVVAGNGGVWGMTGESAGWIVEPEERSEMAGLAGRADEERTIVLGNERWWKRVSVGQIRAATEEETESGWEMLAAAVHGEETAGGEVGAIIKFKAAREALHISEREEAMVQEEIATAERGGKTERKMKLWEWVKEKWPQKQVFVVREGKGDRVKNRKRMGIAAGVFAGALLVIGVGGGIKMQRQGQTTAENEKLMEDMIFNFHMAAGVVGMDVQRSRDLVPVVQQELATLEQRKVKDPRITEVKAGIGDLEARAAGIKKVDLKPVFDLGLVRAGMNSDVVASSDGKLAVGDIANSRLALVDPVKGNGNIIAGSEGLGQLRLVAGYPGKIEALSNEGVVEVAADGSSAKVIIPSDSSWGQIADIKMFAGNIYLLDTGGGDIWRYQANASGDGFGRKQEWLADETARSAVKFGKSMAIDGNIWVAGDGGNLMKFTLGVKQDISVAGWDKPWGDNIVIYTDDSAQKLYILDRDNSRVMIVDKTGQYEMQLVNGNFKNMEGMVVDEAGGRAYLVGQGKVWEADF